MFRFLRSIFDRLDLLADHFTRATGHWRLARMTVAAISFWALCNLGPPCLAAPAAAEEPPALVIIHTSDVHGHALEKRDPESGALTNLGYARLAAYFHRLPEGRKMLLDAGDVLHGQPLATINQGQNMAIALKALNYDALAAGNHDFDYGLSRLMELRDKYALNFLAANIIEKEDGMPLLPACLVKDFEGLKVGVFALTTPETPLKTNPENVKNLGFGTPGEVVELARLMTEKLRREEGVDLVVALTHLGSDPLNRPRAQDVARGAPGLDLIIDGHSHSKLAGLREGGALIVSAGAFLENLGQVTIFRSPEGELILAPKMMAAAELDRVDPDPELQTLVERLSSETDRELNRVVARTPFDLDGRREQVRYGSTNLGRLICAAMREATGADAAIVNSGSIRDSIPAGDISQKQLLNALPYANYTVTVRLTGAELLAALNAGLAQPGEGGFPQFHGLAVTAREIRTQSPEGRLIRRDRAEAVEIGGRTLDPAAEYTVAINDFMRAGGDGYHVLAAPPAREYAMVAEILQNFLASAGPEKLEAIDREDVLTVIVEE